MKLNSSHAVAFLALLVAIGGGIAVAHNGDPAKIHLCIANSGGAVRAVAPDKTCDAGERPQDIRTQHVAYVQGDAGPTRYPAGKAFRRVSSQLIVPGDGDPYLLSGKLVVSKPAGGRTGTVTCRIDMSQDDTANDVTRVTVRPGESESISLLGRGMTNGRLGEVVASVIRCSSPAGRYTVSHLEIAAEPMDTISKGVNGPAAGQPSG